jgi:hypothetical protein
MSSKTEHPATPPENVRIVRPDGTEIPCELRYKGQQRADDGGLMHVWEALSEYVPQAPEDKVKVDTLPARTSISFAFGLPDE